MNATPWTLYAAVALLAWLVAMFGTPLCRRLAQRFDIVDRPSEARKIHHTAIPYLGGLPFYGAFLAMAALVIAWRPELADRAFYPMAALGGIVMLMGLLDDIIGLSSALKLVIELIIGITLYYWGIGEGGFSQPFAGLFHIGWLAPIIAALWVAGVMNAVNFSDGMDGLAGGLVFISAATLFAIGVKNGQTASCLVMACLMGCTLGFLFFNSHPASIFMGDAGALFLGFALAGATLSVQQKGAAVLAMIVPMTALAVVFSRKISAVMIRMMIGLMLQITYALAMVVLLTAVNKEK